MHFSANQAAVAWGWLTGTQIGWGVSKEGENDEVGMVRLLGNNTPGFHSSCSSPFLLLFSYSVFSSIQLHTPISLTTE